MALPENGQIQALCEAVLQLRDERECRAFLEDLCTIKEIGALAQRLEIARRLNMMLTRLPALEEETP